MHQFPDYETVHSWLESLLAELPPFFLEGLNLGVVLLDDAKLHARSRPDAPLYIMGEYQRSNIGAQIVIYYGSYQRVYRGRSYDTIKANLRQTLRHEFRHHVEYRAGERGLVVEDEARLAQYEQVFDD